jgi:hypothetical protein
VKTVTNETVTSEELGGQVRILLSQVWHILLLQMM